MENSLRAQMAKAPLGYGCYALSGAYGTKLSEPQACNVLAQAYDLGVRLYDTADQYGNTEQLLGKALSQYRKQIMIATKVGLAQDKVADLSKSHVITSCEASLRKLKADYIDLYQVHYHDPQTPVEETVAALEQLKKSGKIRYYGVGHLPLAKTLEYLRLGQVSTVLAEMSATSRQRYQELHPYQSSYDFGILAFSVTGRGLLTGGIKSNTTFAVNDLRQVDPLFKKGNLVSGLIIADKLATIGSKYDCSAVQVAIAWTLQKAGVMGALTGPTNPLHLQENLQALSLKLKREDIEELEQFLENEDERKHKAVQKEVDTILTRSLSTDREQAINDLIYVMEYMMEKDLIAYDIGVALYLRILNQRKSKSVSIAELVDIQKKLNSFWF